MRQLMNVKRTKKISNIADVRSIGIIFTVGEKDEWDILYHFAKTMEEKGCQVWMLGYQSTGTTINYIFTHSHMAILHEKEDFTFIGVPKVGLTDAFLQQHYDLLIDTTQEPNFFGKHIALCGKADLKVTYVNDSSAEDPEIEKIFDLLIHGTKPVELRNFLGEIVKYLSMIKK
jgi:hypothetical protein